MARIALTLSSILALCHTIAAFQSARHMAVSQTRSSTTLTMRSSWMNDAGRVNKYVNWEMKNGLSIPRMAPDEEPPEVDPRRRNPDESPTRPPPLMPVVDVGDGQMDVISRLLKDRILLLGQQVNDEVANVLVAQLLYLANEDPEKDITLYINSPGGSVSAGMAIYDTMQYVPCDVATVCFGTAASMGAFLLGAGAPGKRRALPNARIMIHQPLGGAQGQAADVEIQAKEILFIREQLNGFIADYTGQPKDKIEEDCDRDFFMSPEEAKDYGLIDEVVKTKTSHIKKPAMPSLF